MKGLSKTQSSTASAKIGYFQSLRGRMLLFFLAIALVPVIAVGLFAYTRSQNELRASVNARLQSSSNILAENLSDWLKGNFDFITFLSKTPAVQSMDPAQFGRMLLEATGQYKSFEFIFVVGLDGMQIYNTYAVQNKTALQDVKDRTYVIAGLKGEATISDPLVSRSSGNTVIILAAPITAGGKVVGVMAGAVQVNKMNDQMKIGQVGETGDAYLVNNKGLSLTPSRFDADLKKAEVVKTSAALELVTESEGIKRIFAGQQGVDSYYNPNRKTMVVGAYLPLKVQNAHWGLLVEQDTAEAYASAASLGQIMILIVVGVVVLIILISLVVTSRLTGPIITVTRLAHNLSRGEINQQIALQGKDEIGSMAEAFRGLIVYMQDMARAAQEIAEGNLAVEVAPRSDEDVLGYTFRDMIERLSAQVKQVAQGAADVNAASDKLSLAAEQAGQATNQIAATIQQVARGTSQQTESITQTATSIESVSQAVRNMAKGNQQQAQAIQKASQASQRLNSHLQDLAESSIRAAEGGANATKVSTQGAQTVGETIQAINLIRASVDASAGKVHEMGQRSDQIGAIVETIDEIASQTNLLALNAAIEAARAGEHGKGFSIVADEVRKLAERSSKATKEIDGLIKSIQATISEAVMKMNESLSAVNKGVETARQANQALESIVQTGETVREVSLRSVEISQQARQVAAELVMSMDSIARVAEENSQAAQSVSSNVSGVTEAIESIASVSEENSAAVEEVSASTEEMTAQVNEVSDSAAALVGLAQQLRTVVAAFRL